MDEMDDTGVETAGERLRAARIEKGLSLEDVAAQTRIPQRHLESLEAGEWSKLPAPTYTIGFARSYATAIGLDRTEISDRLRGEMGGQRPTAAAPEVFEPADPARTMPKWLVFGALAAVLLLVLVMSWLSRRSLEGPAEPTDNVAVVSSPTAPQVPVSVPATPAAAGAVAITANEPVWLQVYEKGGKSFFSGELAAGQRFDVPPGSAAPLLKTGKPEALRISVGTADAPPVGPAATTVRDVSLLGPDLMRGGSATTATPAPAADTAR